MMLKGTKKPNIEAKPMIIFINVSIIFINLATKVPPTPDSTLMIISIYLWLKLMHTADATFLNEIADS
ncbi:hypothetical protein CISIN_1g035342mg [Citrus sinensis]|uniref:Uncharacterized protein n=1 Tax=Citrus sinensis TaxID=2711 RepID=A0A067E7Q0_CITSI|nr:hypothetical protein CISIN_1g035342mg [Citrus sinensis]